MPAGRPRNPGTDAERAQARREKVRLNVQAHRKRRKEQQGESRSGSESSSRSRSNPSSVDGRDLFSTTSDPISPANILQCPQHRVKLTQELNGLTLSWALQLPFRLDVGFMYRDAFIAAFQYRCLSDTLSSQSAGYVRVAICCSTWVTTACFQASSHGCEMLSDALLSSALNIMGRVRNDESMTKYGLCVQERALRRLRHGFGQLIAGNKTEGELKMLSATILACAMSELLASKSWRNFGLHLQGVGALIEFAGIDALCTPEARDHFYGFRAVQSAFSFIDRQASFLGNQEWISFSWRHEHALANSPVHALLDIAYQIPLEMQLYDEDPCHRFEDLLLQLQRLSAIRLQLEQWETNLTIGHTMPIYKSPISSAVDTEMQFSNMAVATAFTYATGVIIALLDLRRQILDELRHIDRSLEETSLETITEALKWSRTACQCINYFTNIERNTVGKLICLFPLDMAWKMFTCLKGRYDLAVSADIFWCRETAERFAKMGLPALRLH